MQHMNELRSSLSEGPSGFRLLNTLGESQFGVEDFQRQKDKSSHSLQKGQESTSNVASALRKALSNQPSQGLARDIFRLQYLAMFHDQEAIRYNTQTALLHQVS